MKTQGLLVASTNQVNCMSRLTRGRSAWGMTTVSDL